MRKLLTTSVVLLSFARIFAQGNSAPEYQTTQPFTETTARSGHPVATAGATAPGLARPGLARPEQERPRTEEYCEFTLAGAFGQPGKCSVRLDLGQFHGGWPSLVDKLRNETGDLLLFNSAVDALNYLNGYGWQLFSVYNDSSTTYYVMRRKVLPERDEFQ